MTRKEQGQALDLLLVEDNPADVRLVQLALQANTIPYRLAVATDGEAALAYLRKEGVYAQVSRPDLVLLDLNLPRKDGRAVLAELKDDPTLHSLPVIMFTNSQREADVRDCYQLHANAYVVKPEDVEAFFQVIQQIEAFWFSIATLFEEEDLPGNGT